MASLTFIPKTVATVTAAAGFETAEGVFHAEQFGGVDGGGAKGLFGGHTGADEPGEFARVLAEHGVDDV